MNGTVKEINLANQKLGDHSLKGYAVQHLLLNDKEDKSIDLILQKEDQKEDNNETENSSYLASLSVANNTLTTSFSSIEIVVVIDTYVIRDQSLLYIQSPGNNYFNWRKMVKVEGTIITACWKESDYKLCYYNNHNKEIGYIDHGKINNDNNIKLICNEKNNLYYYKYNYHDGSYFMYKVSLAGSLYKGKAVGPQKIVRPPVSLDGTLYIVTAQGDNADNTTYTIAKIDGSNEKTGLKTVGNNQLEDVVIDGKKWQISLYNNGKAVKLKSEEEEKNAEDETLVQTKTQPKTPVPVEKKPVIQHKDKNNASIYNDQTVEVFLKKENNKLKLLVHNKKTEFENEIPVPVETELDIQNKRTQGLSIALNEHKLNFTYHNPKQVLLVYKDIRNGNLPEVFCEKKRKDGYILCKNDDNKDNIVYQLLFKGKKQ